MGRSATVSVEDVLYFQADPKFKSIDGSLRQSWNEADGLFDDSRSSILRLVDMSGHSGFENG